MPVVFSVSDIAFYDCYYCDSFLPLCQPTVFLSTLQFMDGPPPPPLCQPTVSLSTLQFMDGARRFVTQHIEYEPEWETAFHLQLKMHDCIALMLKWCRSERAVLSHAYNALLARLIGYTKDLPTVRVTGESALCIDVGVGIKCIQ